MTMKWDEITDRLETTFDNEGWTPMTWPRQEGGVTRFRAREVRDRREDDRVRIRIHAEDQKLIGCDQVELVRAAGDTDQIYFVRDVPTEFIDEPDSVGVNNDQ